MLDWIRNMRRSLRQNSTARKPRVFRPGIEAMEERCLLATHFLQTNLVSDIPGLAEFTDSQLINPFGITASSKSDFWLSDNQVGLSTLYNGQGVKAGLVVNIQDNIPTSFTHATPTGTVFNTDTSPTDFVVGTGMDMGPSIFMFATLDGTIQGWNGTSKNSIIAVPQSNGAIFTGLAIDTSASEGNTLLYATDWWNDQVDVFNGSFKPATGLATNAFQDPAIPAGFNPFGIQDLNGHIFVTYAQFDPMTSADTGVGGFVAEFTRDGKLETTISSSQFNSPWGLAMAPAGFGDASGDLLVAGFGDGHINAFAPTKTGGFRFAETLQGPNGKPFTVTDLWGIRFGNGAGSGSTTTLYFTAGVTDAPATPFGASDGLFGSLQAIPTLIGPLLPTLSKGAVQTISTVPTTGTTAGDQNPYGVAFVPANFKGTGVLQPGDLLVSDFNNAGTMANPGGEQGRGSTIMRFTPQGGSSIFFAGAPGLGLTTALGVLQNGDVIVGSLPTTGGTSATIQPGALLVLDANGKVLETITDNQLLDSPWDLTINDRGDRAQVFVSNAVSGKIARIDLSVPLNGTPIVESETLIGSGFTSKPDVAALILGPTGLALNAQTNTLFVASTADNTIFEISNAGTRVTSAGKGTDIFHGQPNPALHGPLGLVLAPNGDLIVANGDAVNPDATHPSELLEFSAGGKLKGTFSVDASEGGAFGVALEDTNGQLRFAAVDDVTNTVSTWTFELPPPAPRKHK